MTRLEKIEREISSLSEAEFRQLADWISERNAELWDRQIEADAASGRLDALADQALAAHKSGRSRPV